VQLAQYTDDTALIATSCDPSLLIANLEAYLGRLELWLRNWRIANSVSYSTAVLFAEAVRRARQSTPVQFLREQIQWVQTARCLGVTLDTQLTWTAPVHQVRKKAAQRLGMRGPLLNRKIGLSVSNGVLLYKQLIRPMMDYACPIWRSAARSNVQKLQVLQSKCLRIAANAPWYVGNRQIHEQQASRGCPSKDCSAAGLLGCPD
jgi:hypothetical protein